jgi:hypothetical protein
VTINAGTLQLQITEQGAAAVEKKLKDIDTQAKKLGGTPIQIPVAPVNTSLVDRQLAQMGQQITLFRQGAQQAGTKAGSLRELGAIENQLRNIVAGTNTTLEQRIGAERQLNQLLGGRKAGTESLTAAIGRNILAYVGFSTAVNAYNAVTGAADRQEVAQMRLSATAKLTGQSLATVTEFANRARDQFKIGAGDAADLPQAFFKMASRAGDVSKSGALMTAWMDLAASQGIPLSRVIDAVTNALNGNDDGLNRIGLMDPGAIYAKWGPAVGAVNSQLTAQQKAMAIVNEVLEQGEKARGSYTAWLESTPGKQQAVNSVMQDAGAIIGNSFKQMREGAYGLGTAFAELIVWGDKYVSKWDQWAHNVDGKTLGFIDRGVNWLFAAAGKQRPSSAAPAQDTSVDGTGMFASVVAGQIPKPKAPPTAAQTAAARAAADQRAIDRALALSVGMPGVVGEGGFPKMGMPGAATTLTGEKAFGLANVVDKQLDAVREKLLAKQELLTGVAMGVAESISGALADGFNSAFSGDDNFFAALGKSLLSSLGNILVQIGASMVTYGALMTPLAGIPGPWQALGLGAMASLAAGVGLMALGAGMGALAGGGSKGGGGGSDSRAPTAEVERDDFAVAFDPDRKLRKSGPAVMPGSRGLSNAPMPEGRPVVHIGTINSLSPDDAKWQRAVAETYTNARNRGLVRSG